jgi:hypothetical protein
MSIANRLKIDIFLLSGLRFVSSYAVPRLYTAQHSTATAQHCHSTAQHSTALHCHSKATAQHCHSTAIAQP